MGANPQIEGEDWNKFSFTIAQAEVAIGEDFNRLKQKLNPANRIAASQALDDARKDCHSCSRGGYWWPKASATCKSKLRLQPLSWR